MISDLAKQLSTHGRNGDSTLVHMHPDEVKGLASLVPGGLTKNPTTGLPEAFSLWPLLGGLMLGGLGGMFLPGMLGMGAAGGAAAAGGAGAAASAAPAAAGIGSMLSSPLVMGAGLGGLALADQMMAPTPPKLKKQKSGFHDYSYEASPDENGNFSGGYTYSGDDPNMQSYQPMYMAAGGPISGTSYPVPYGMSPTSQGSDKRFDKQLVHAAIVALTSGSNPEAIQHFVARFGQAALSDLAQRVRRLGPPQGMGLAQSGPENDSPVGQLVPSGMRGGGAIQGGGDGQSDSVPAMAGAQRVQLSNGEFVLPADAVSHLGNGSTEAGIGHLQKMVDRLRKARTGSSVAPPQIHAQNMLST